MHVWVYAHMRIYVCIHVCTYVCNVCIDAASMFAGMSDKMNVKVYVAIFSKCCCSPNLEKLYGVLTSFLEATWLNARARLQE